MADGEVLQSIKVLLRTIYQDIKATDTIVNVAVVISLLFTLVSMALSLYFIIAAFHVMKNNAMMSTIVNEEALDYQVSKTYNTLFTFGFNYKYFLVLPWLQLIPFIMLYAAIMGKKRVNPSYSPYFGTTVIIVMCVLFVQIVIAFVSNYAIYFSTDTSLSPINRRIREFNKYVYKRMYKGVSAAGITTTFKFYSAISSVEHNPFTLQRSVKRALHQLPNKISAETLAQALFTVNMFVHFHKLGARSPSLQKAVSLFNPTRLLLPGFFSPADYLFKKGTFIDDIGELLGDQRLRYLSPEILKNKNMVNQAVLLNAEWIAEANNRGNNIYAEDSFIPFMVMAVLMLFFQVATVGVLIWFFIQPTSRDYMLKLFNPSLL